MNKLIRNTIQLIIVDINILVCAWILDSVGHTLLSQIAVLVAAVLTVLFIMTLALLGKDYFK
jgi:hypothetical protein